MRCTMDESGIQLRTDQTDHKVVVVLGQTMAGQANVATQPGTAICPPDAAMFHERRALFLCD